MPKIIDSLVNSGDLSMNEAGTRPKIDAWLTQWCSLPVQEGQRVYFIRGGGFIKIGFSTNPLARLIDLRTASPFELELLADIPGSKDDELQIHRLFSDLHVRGEWFRDDDRILAFIKQTRVETNRLGWKRAGRKRRVK